MDTGALIEMRDGVRGGKPCFVGTRITVYDVLEYLAGDMSAEQIVADFPSSPMRTFGLPSSSPLAVSVASPTRREAAVRREPVAAGSSPASSTPS